ncbi:hypothetical protein ACFQEY_07960 [Halorubrum trueperi]
MELCGVGLWTWSPRQQRFISEGLEIDPLRTVGHNTIPAHAVSAPMRSEEEVREQYEFLREQLEDEEMNHRGVEELFTHYKRALGWVLEEEHM